MSRKFLHGLVTIEIEITQTNVHVMYSIFGSMEKLFLPKLNASVRAKFHKVVQSC